MEKIEYMHTKEKILYIKSSSMSTLSDSFCRWFGFYAPQWIYTEKFPDSAVKGVTAKWWEGDIHTMTVRGSVALQEKGWQRALQKRTPEGYNDNLCFRKQVGDLDKGTTRYVVEHEMERMSMIISEAEDYIMLVRGRSIKAKNIKKGIKIIRANGQCLYCKTRFKRAWS